MKSFDPHTFIRRHAGEIARLLPGVAHADPEAIHDARVAIRRVRAALPLISQLYPNGSIKKVDRTLQRIGRALGAVRDGDVIAEVLARIATRRTDTAGAVTFLQSDLRDEQLTARRRLARRLNDARLMPRLQYLARLRRPLRSLPFTRGNAWRTELEDEVGSAGRKLRKAMRRAGTEYLPDPVHRVRVQAKKLRYLLEFASRAKLCEQTVGISTLRRVQDTIGELHDHQVLADRISEEQVGMGSLAEPLAQAVNDEIRTLHDNYLRERFELRQITEAAEQLGAAKLARVLMSPRSKSLVAASAIAIPPTLWLLSTARPRGKESD